MLVHSSLARLDHRPWPLPQRPWVWRQSWRDLLFAHWPIDAAHLRPLIPDGLRIQEFDGTAWVGLVPFRMAGVMRRPFPDLPWISAFPELNVRTYVERNGRQGVWFLSLDATNILAVWAARTFFHLPYIKARMALTYRSDWILYESHRHGAEFQGAYRPTSDVYRSAYGSLEHWLTERYCLFAQDKVGRLWSTDVHHEPWPLQKAEAMIEVNSMFASHGLRIEGPPPVLHFALRVDVVAWSGERVL